MSNEVTRDQPAAVYVADSEIHGKGLFAAQEFSAGSYIGFYEGEETTENGTYVLWVHESTSPEGEEEWIGYDGNNELRFLNHAKDPSCEMDGQALYALWDIARGEELTFDYGEWFEES